MLVVDANYPEQQEELIKEINHSLSTPIPIITVFNKIDLLPPEEASALIADVVKQLQWQQPVYQISALKKQGTQALCYQLMDALSDSDHLAEG